MEMQSVQVALMKLSSEIGLEPGLWIRDSWQKFADPLPETQNERSASFLFCFRNNHPCPISEHFRPIACALFFWSQKHCDGEILKFVAVKNVEIQKWTVWCTRQLFCGFVFIPQSHPFKNHRLEIRWSFEINPTSVSRIVGEIWVGFDAVVNHIAVSIYYFVSEH